MSPGDVLLSAVLLAAAGALLVRSLRRTGSGCAGCPGGCQRPPRAAEPLMKLGPPREGGGPRVVR